MNKPHWLTAIASHSPLCGLSSLHFVALLLHLLNRAICLLRKCFRGSDQRPDQAARLDDHRARCGTPRAVPIPGGLLNCAGWDTLAAMAPARGGLDEATAAARLRRVGFQHRHAASQEGPSLRCPDPEALQVRRQARLLPQVKRRRWKMPGTRTREDGRDCALRKESGGTGRRDGQDRTLPAPVAAAYSNYAGQPWLAAGQPAN